MPETAPQLKTLAGEIYIDCEFIKNADFEPEFHRIKDISFKVGRGDKSLFLNITDATIGRNKIGDILAARYTDIESLVAKQDAKEAAETREWSDVCQVHNGGY